MLLRTNVYIDAFNLYFGALKGTRWKWLDLEALCRRLLPGNDIRRIRYFTALVTARPHDPGQPVRQQTYLRALRTNPKITVHLGHFLSNPVTLPLADDPARFARVLRTEEKGSDVNLATHLLCDGFTDDYDAAVIVSNDSDLLEPIRIAKNKLNKKVGVVSPQVEGPPSRVLMQEAIFFRKLRRSVLPACQLPQTLKDATGEFRKPGTW